MRRYLLLLSVVPVLAGCATSIAGLGEKAPARIWESSKAAELVASCLATELNGTNQMLKMGEGHYVVTRVNGYGIPVVRWDMFQVGTGSRIELRASFGLMEGEPKARACADLPPD